MDTAASTPAVFSTTYFSLLIRPTKGSIAIMSTACCLLWAQAIMQPYHMH